MPVYDYNNVVLNVNFDEGETVKVLPMMRVGFLVLTTT